MILEGSQRGGARQAADHFTNTEDNEHVEVHGIRGFIAQTVHGALMESYAISQGTRCRQHMFSVSLNPPPQEDVSISDFEDALLRLEQKLGLEDQPRIVVFHEKEGRRHAHAVFCRIDRQSMTAINLPYYKMKLQDVTRELFIEHKWKMPPGLINSRERDPNNFTLAEWQQARRTKQSPAALKSLFRECWAASDSKTAFEHALKERGFLLAKGERRSFVAVDYRGEIYSLSRMIGIKTKELEERLGNFEFLPSVEQRQAYFAGLMDEALRAQVEETEEHRVENEHQLTKKRIELVAEQRAERRELADRQQKRLFEERRQRQEKLAGGLRGLWDRLTGKQGRILEENIQADKLSILRDLQEREGLIRRQLKERGRLQIFVDRVRERRASDSRIDLTRSPSEIKQKSRDTKRIRRDPEHLLSLMIERESIFTRDDIAKALGAYVQDPREFRSALSQIMSSRLLVELQQENREKGACAFYSTHEMVALEIALMSNAAELAKKKSSEVSRSILETALKHQDAELRSSSGARLSTEQQEAIRHVTGDRQLACVVGVAGAGKSTMLKAARRAWEQSGYRVIGAALAGKAAKGLEQSSGINSKTLASLELSWSKGFDQLQMNDVLVIDEAGMIGSKQMAKFISEAKARGAKIVLVGDAEQLQPIGAGSPFRAIAQKIDPVSLQTVHRQKQSWQREASWQFASDQTQKALQTYRDHNAVNFADTGTEAKDALVADYLKDMIANGDKTSRVALAHRRADVREINDTIRYMRKVCGELEHDTNYQTAHGQRAFAAGDRLLFTRNDRELGVKNGMLATVVQTGKANLTVRLDSDNKEGEPITLAIPIRCYDAFDHGYATTIHKSQGATVDRSFVLASTTLDRHLTYVAMTRHKDETALYVAKEEFPSFGKLVSLVSRARQKRSTLDFDRQTASEDHSFNSPGNERAEYSREYG